MITLLSVIALALVMMVIERVRPARNWPRVRSWWPRALAINGFQIASVFIAGATWERWFGGAHLLALGDDLVVGYLAYALWLYWSHRWRHSIDLLWRWTHQLHHSPARVEILTAFYKHPLEILIESFVAALLLYGVLGVSREAAFAITNASGVLGLFYHWNVATPRWLGYVVQRPESHCIHHQHGVHAFNYSELPLLDIVFGTFRNPERFVGACGLGDDREQRFGALLAGVDVTRR